MKQQYNLRLSLDLLQKIRAEADRRGMTVTGFITQSVESGFNQPLCKCGKYIRDENIDFESGITEDGEDNYMGTAHCVCGAKYEWSQWTECTNIWQAKNDLQLAIDEEY